MSLQKKMGGMVNEGRRYMEEVVCSVRSKGCVKTVGRLLEEFTSDSHLLERWPSRGQVKYLLSSQATPQSFFF